MRTQLLAVAVVLMSTSAVRADEPTPARSLRVLYVGNASTQRGLSYARFLAERFKLVGAVERESFDPRSAAAADVVVLDWSQADVRFERGDGGLSEGHLKSPLGGRNRWDRPTVLLGSAGHLLAAPWKIFGGSG